jgi:hypothetical protein
MANRSVTSSILSWGWTLSIFLLISFLICVAFGLLVPGQFHMHEAWAPLLPGFVWLTLPGFLAGALGSFLYGWYIAVLGVPLYRYFRGRFA